jgi:hypothetical protein
MSKNSRELLVYRDSKLFVYKIRKGKVIQENETYFIYFYVYVSTIFGY